jgi:hypothetical protein
MRKVGGRCIYFVRKEGSQLEEQRLLAMTFYECMGGLLPSNLKSFHSELRRAIVAPP